MPVRTLLAAASLLCAATASLAQVSREHLDTVFPEGTDVSATG